MWFDIKKIRKIPNVTVFTVFTTFFLESFQKLAVCGPWNSLDAQLGLISTYHIYSHNLLKFFTMWIFKTRRYGALWAPTSRSCGELVACGHLEGPSHHPVHNTFALLSCVLLLVPWIESLGDCPETVLTLSREPVQYLQHGSNVNNVTEEEKGRGPAQVWGSDIYIY